MRLPGGVRRGNEMGRGEVTSASYDRHIGESGGEGAAVTAVRVVATEVGGENPCTCATGHEVSE